VEFLVEFELSIPDDTPKAEVQVRQDAEASSAKRLAEEGHLVRLWRSQVAPGDAKVLGLYRADDETELDSLLGALPLSEWMHVTVTALGLHPNDPAATKTR
jgi:muconolactone D-isomerase